MSKEKTALTVRLDDIHWEIIEGLTPFYGSNRGEVIRNIIIMWLDGNLGSSTVKELKENQAIKLGSKK
jgi:hypothetical protein